MTDFPTLLRAAGEALYGSRWQAPLARDLDVTKRTMQRWASGSLGVRDVDALRNTLRRLLAERAIAISGVLKAL